MLYTKPINDITYQDVLDFCEQKTPENFRLDYKRELPSSEKIAKLISAFANTFGGLIVVGIEAPKGIPEKPFEGIHYDKNKKYEEQIQSIIISHIKEPVFPEIKVCVNQNNKAFIIIRVQESDITPHRVGNDSKVYVRTGEINTPTEKLDKSIDEAKWGKIEWLITKRNKSIKLRNHMIQEAETFYKESLYTRDIAPEKYFGIVTFRMLPKFPQGQLITNEQFSNIEDKIWIGQGINLFPRWRFNLDTIQNGLQCLYFYSSQDDIPQQDDPFFFLHITNLGMYMYKWDAGTANSSTDSAGNKILTDKGIKNIELIAIEIYQYFSSAIVYYQHLGFMGTFLLEIEFDNVLGLKVPFTIKKLSVPRSYMKWSRTFIVAELESRKKEIAIDIVSDIAWSFGIRTDFRDNISKYLENQNFQY